VAERQQIPLDAIDPHAVTVVRRLRRFGHKAYLVGGCVRDLLLGVRPKDFDVATSATPEEIRVIFRNSRIVGRRFRLAHVFYQDGKVIEVATFRTRAPEPEVDDTEEEAPDLLIRHDNWYGTEVEDAQRRDFTMNGLLYDISHGKVIDHVGGLADLQARHLRMIGDPDVRLREDPVRTLRAIRFQAKIGLTLEPELAQAMVAHREEITRCAPARILEETLKLLRTGFAQEAIRRCESVGVLEVLVPELVQYMDGASEGNSRQRLYDHLKGLDAFTRTWDHPPSDAVIIGALLYAPLADLYNTHTGNKGIERQEAVADTLSRFAKRLALTRKTNEQLRQIISLQRTLGKHPWPNMPKSRRRVNPDNLIRRPFFEDALDLYEIRLRSLGEDLVEISDWRRRARLEPIPSGANATSAENIVPFPAAAQRRPA
jgi:poly(A) polymerase